MMMMMMMFEDVWRCNLFDPAMSPGIEALQKAVQVAKQKLGEPEAHKPRVAGKAWLLVLVFCWGLQGWQVGFLSHDLCGTFLHLNNWWKPRSSNLTQKIQEVQMELEKRLEQKADGRRWWGVDVKKIVGSAREDRNCMIELYVLYIYISTTRMYNCVYMYHIIIPFILYSRYTIPILT